MSKRNLIRISALILSLICLAGCARTVVKPETETRNSRLAKPHQILVYDFAVNEAEVRAAQGPFKETGNESSEREQDRKIGRQVANALAEELMSELRDLGFHVERKPRGAPVGSGQLLINGEFIDVDEGNRLKRLVIGFGMGASRMDTEVHVTYGPNHRKLLDFKTHSDSGMMPGAAATMGAGAVVAGGVTAGAIVAEGAAGAVKEYQSEVERMAAHSGDQAVDYLSEFFAKEGWIRPDQVRKPKLEK